jgi:tetratricopeptide (TPR) repeat protein
MRFSRGAAASYRFLTAALVAFTAAALSLAGCDRPPPTRIRRNADQAAAEQDHLALALAALKRYHEGGASDSSRQLLYELNRWLTSQPLDDTWKRDPQLDRLPRRFREMPELASLDSQVFTRDDSEYLQEAYLLRAIAQWVSRDATERWIEAKRAEVADPALADPAMDSPEYRLEMARSVFDWTVRHIQLDELLPAPQAAKGAVAGPGNEAPADVVPPPAQAIPGPGYRYYPHQILMFGRGDAWQRARVFILIARQLNLDAVMIAVDDRGPGSRASPWCPAVLIDDKLYLFDTALGLPIPGEEQGSIATLAEVRANPNLLRRLDLEEENLTYPVTESQLKSVAALVDATGEALSRRMKMLEERLTGEDSMMLAVSPAEIARRIRACPGLEKIDVRLWSLPLETRMYREAMERLSRGDPEIERRLVQEKMAFFPVVESARHLHFLGRIESQDEQEGAISLYMQSRKAEELIDEIQTSEDARQRIGLPPLPSNVKPEQRQMFLALQAAQYRLNKQHASYWIGLAQYDLGEYETAIHWLKDRTLDAFPNGVWTAGARYNLGRTYEALGRIEDARRVYYQSESHQRHGNLLRAKLLRGA